MAPLGGGCLGDRRGRPGRAGGGKKNAILSIAGFVLLLFSYSIVNLFITQEHMFQ